MQALLALALLLVLLPAIYAQRERFGFGGVQGGIEIDMSDAEGEVAGGGFQLDLPLKIHNRTDHVVMRVEMWTDAWACPDAWTPASGCRKLLSSGQSFDTMLEPGRSTSLSSTLTGGANNAPDGATVRIVRRVVNIFDEQDIERNKAYDEVR